MNWHFQNHADEHGQFDRIPIEERRHPRSDICACIYLHEKLGGTGRVIDKAIDDKIWFDYSWLDIEKLTEEDVIYLVRCGIIYHSGDGFLSMNV